MEIERKYLVNDIPFDLSTFDKNEISQGYIVADPAVRIRRKNDKYILTIKSGGLLARHEFEKELTKDEFDELSQMVSGNIISKTRYIIPYNGLKIELDIFHDKFEGLKYAEVEFPDIEGAKSFIAPDYFGEEVTEDASYQNSSLSRMSPDEISLFLKNNK